MTLGGELRRHLTIQELAPQTAETDSDVSRQPIPTDEGDLESISSDSDDVVPTPTGTPAQSGAETNQETPDSTSIQDQTHGILAQSRNAHAIAQKLGRLSEDELFHHAEFFLSKCGCKLTKSKRHNEGAQRQCQRRPTLRNLVSTGWLLFAVLQVLDRSGTLEQVVHHACGYLRWGPPLQDEELPEGMANRLNQLGFWRWCFAGVKDGANFSDPGEQVDE